MSKLSDFKGLTPVQPTQPSSAPVTPSLKPMVPATKDMVAPSATLPKGLPKNVDEARELQKTDRSAWQVLSDNLMKPVGVVATISEQLGKSIGEGSIDPLLKLPSKIGGIITGTNKRNFSNIWNEGMKNLGVDPRIGSAIGLVFDIAADPLNALGGGLTKAGQLAEKVSALRKAGEVIKADSKLANEIKALGLNADDLILADTKEKQAQLGQRAFLYLMTGRNTQKTLLKGDSIYRQTKGLGEAWGATKAANVLNKVFSTKTSNEAFNKTIEHFRNLKEYRDGKAMDEALDIQKQIADLPAEDMIKIRDVVEGVAKSDDATINTIAARLKANFADIRKTEEALGLMKTDIEAYYPHYLEKNKLGEKIMDTVKGARKWSTASGNFKERKLKVSASEAKELFGVEFSGRPAVDFARRALGSAKAVTSKEFFESIKPFATKDGVEVTAKELAGMKFAPDVAAQIDDYAKRIQPEELNVALRTIDAVQNWWKAQALVAPSYHIRNFVGNMWNNHIAGVRNPDSYMKAGAIQRGKPIQFVDAAGREWSTPALVDAAKKNGVIGRGWYAADIEQGLKSELGGNSWNPLKQNFGLYKANRQIGEYFENNSRLAHFIDKLKTGSTVEDAARSVKKYLFNYNELTAAERNLFKRIAPFYTWTRKNIPLQLETLVTDPTKFGTIAKTTEAIEQNVVKPNEEWLGSYIKDNVGVRVKTDAQGNTHYFLMGNWIPAAQAIDFLSQPVENFIMSVSPFVKMPIELWSNQSTYFDDSFGDPAKIERYPQENQSWLGLTMRKKTANVLKNIRILNELDKLNPGGIFGTEDSPSLLSKIAPKGAGVTLPVVGTITPAEKRLGRFTPEVSQTARMFQSLFGKTSAYNPAYARKFYLWDKDTKIRELEKAIKDAQKDGQSEYAKRLRQELQSIKRGDQK